MRDEQYILHKRPRVCRFRPFTGGRYMCCPEKMLSKITRSLSLSIQSTASILVPTCQRETKHIHNISWPVSDCHKGRHGSRVHSIINIRQDSASVAHFISAQRSFDSSLFTCCIQRLHMQLVAKPAASSVHSVQGTCPHTTRSRLYRCPECPVYRNPTNYCSSST